MTREFERSDGLALLGRGSLGAIRLELPALLEDPFGSPAGLIVRSRESPSGTRTLAVSSGSDEVTLRFPILNPEIAVGGTGVHPLGEGCVLLHAPFGVEELRAASRPGLVVLGNARALWNGGPGFLEAIRDLRAAVGPGPILWAPRVALPHRVPFLFYLGIDLIDTTEGAWRAARGEYLDPALGPIDRDAFRRERACDCPACASDAPGPLADHARIAYRRAVAESRAAIRAGRLRELVESRLVAEPALGEMLPYVDQLLAGPLEERTPVTGSGTRAYVLAESQRRPEMQRFRQRLVERYRPPPSKSILLLVPCSQRKPYRTSRSHRRFAAALEGLAGRERVHVVSVSSPIGLVPRELEDVYPARHYDIPVTGDWTDRERAQVLTGLEHLRRSGAYRSILVHLDPEEYSFVAGPLGGGSDVRWTVRNGSTTSPEALASLRDAVARELDAIPPLPGGPLAVVREELRELASVQFGRSTAERLFAPPVRLAGRPWFQRVTDGKVDLATVREERGLFHLTVAGAERIGAPYPLAVEIDPAVPLTGDLFAPGVRSADPEIRTGDSVVLVRAGELAGVGEAARPGPLMTAIPRGLAVKVRHRAGTSTDTSMTARAPAKDDGPVV